MLSTLVIFLPSSNMRTPLIDCMTVHRVFDYDSIIKELLKAVEDSTVDSIIFDDEGCTGGWVNDEFQFQIFED